MNSHKPKQWFRPQTAAKAVPFLLLLTLLLGAFDSATPVIYIIGDSTAANKDTTEGRIERGWGMCLHEYLDDGVRVEDHAVNGRSSRSFYAEGRWQKVIDKVKPGDYVIIQFGHNDEKPARREAGTRPAYRCGHDLRRSSRAVRHRDEGQGSHSCADESCGAPQLPGRHPCRHTRSLSLGGRKGCPRVWCRLCRCQRYYPRHRAAARA